MPLKDLPPLISEKTPVPLRWMALALVLGLSLGGGYALGQAKAAQIEQDVGAVKLEQAKQGEKLHALDTRTALVEQAVVSLARIAERLSQ